LKNIGILLLFLLFGSCGEKDPMEPLSPDHYKHIREKFSELEVASGELNSRTLLVHTGVRTLLPAFTLMYDDLLQIPDVGWRLCHTLLEDYQKSESLIFHAFRLLGAPAGGHSPPLAALKQEAPSIPGSFLDTGEESWRLLPEELQVGILNTLQGCLEAELVLQQFRAPLLADLKKQEIHKDQYLEYLMLPWKERQLWNYVSIDLIQQADLRKLSLASRLVASSLDGLTQCTPLDVPEGFESCILDTRIGRVGIFGAQSDTIAGAFSLVIDLGGDDLYLGNIASPSAESGAISVVLDFAGNDTYQSTDGHLLQACLGIAILYDLAGNDQYVSEQAGIASACYGTALLKDWCGDDIYLSSSAFSQGAAHVGVGLLLDLEGDDEYHSSGSSQAYGGSLGVGLLLDLTGSDGYNQNQEPASFVQGAGRGRWAEAGDGHSLGGGLGIFIEAGGADHYEAESFSQGASYFTGTGLFFELGGDDHYQALSHSQGYAAHFALAGFFEMEGDDRYNSRSNFGKITQVLGGGRDQSAGWFIEEQGNDMYHLGNRSGGIGDLNGVGILWDRKGVDSYTWHQNRVNARAPSLGYTIPLAEGMALTPRLKAFPENLQLGFFKDDHKSKLRTEKVR